MGSSPTLGAIECRGVEQLVARRAHNPKVEGSSPSSATIKKLTKKCAKLIWLLGQAVKTPPFHGGNRGSIPLGVTIFYNKIFVFGSIAQLGEHLPYKQGVTGSSPVTPTINAAW